MQTLKLSNEDIKTLEDLEKFLGKEKLVKFFIEHYIKSQAKELKELKLSDDDFNVEDIFE